MKTTQPTDSPNRPRAWSAFVLIATLAWHPAGAGNLLINPSFEEGREPWYSLASASNPYWNDFTLAPVPGSDDERCARLELTMPGKPTKAAVWGTIQKLESLAQMPRNLRGRYFVETWTRGTGRQYIQIALSLKTTRKQRSSLIEEMPQANIPLQLAIVLAGVEEPPLQLSNRKFELSGVVEPEIGRWIDFDYDLHDLFSRHWGVVPSEMVEIQLFFDVRYDERAEDETSGHAVVLFDNLYLGHDEPIH